METNGMTYGERVRFLLKKRLKLPLLWFYDGLSFSVLLYLGWIGYPELGLNVLWFPLSLAVWFFLCQFLSCFIEAKHYLIGVSEREGCVVVKYYRFNKERVYEVRQSLLRYRLSEGYAKGVIYDESIKVGVRTETTYFKKELTFYAIGPWTKESLREAFPKMTK